ncbi:hypothetical protein D3C73_960780 [compost metagenome]
MRRGVGRLEVAVPVADDARGGAARLLQLAVHVDQLEACGGRRVHVRPVVQVVDVLRHQQDIARPPRRQIGQRPVRGVGVDARQLAASLVVEVLHQGRVGGEALGRGDGLDTMPLPQAVRGAEGGHAALGRDAGAGQDDEVHLLVLRLRRWCANRLSEVAYSGGNRNLARRS